ESSQAYLESQLEQGSLNRMQGLIMNLACLKQDLARMVFANRLPKFPVTADASFASAHQLNQSRFFQLE
ncbi:MAG: hypothetical protein P8J33_15680, partial [Pirellulaceae bacterium]|nr:hypothetical protein [Pirellulaceae bacterium]